jgi:hypothetical protein
MLMTWMLPSDGIIFARYNTLLPFAHKELAWGITDDEINAAEMIKYRNV